MPLRNNFLSLNPPEKPNVGDLKKEMPQIVKNIQISIYPILNLEGYKIARITRLNPKPIIKENLSFDFIEGVYKFKIDELNLWNIIVVELKKEKRRK